MKKMRDWLEIALAAVVLLGASAPGADTPVGTGFTYQGRIEDDGNIATGPYDLQFRLFDAETGGAEVGTVVTIDDVAVVDGLFTVTLDFGADAFDGHARWLEMAVRPGDETGDYTTLSPRQRLTPVPFAVYASKVPSQITGHVTVVNTESSVLAAFQATSEVQSGSTSGLYGGTTSISDNAAGVVGVATAASGVTAGVHGKTNSTATKAAGVRGEATAAEGFTAGVYGTTMSATAGAAGVVGATGAPEGATYGVYGMSMSATEGAAGVKGTAKGVYGKGVGVRGETGSTREDSAGVYGQSGSDYETLLDVEPSSSRGVVGVGMGLLSDGVYGKVSHSEGTGAGVRGVTQSRRSESAGVYGESAFDGDGEGMESSSYGVVGKGRGRDSDGVIGWATHPEGIGAGVHGVTASKYGNGVYGYASEEGVNYGVHGQIASKNPDAAGVYGETLPDEENAPCSSRGVYGLGRGFYSDGVCGKTEHPHGWGAGVRGVTKSRDPLSAGVCGESALDGDGEGKESWSDGVLGVGVGACSDGVYGTVMHSEGTGAGVRGVTMSTTATSAGVHAEAKTGAVGLLAKSASGNPIEGWNSSQRVFRVANDGNVYAKGSFQPGGGDFAEMLPGADGLEPGDVLAVDRDGKVILAGPDNAMALVGVYSTQPGFVGGTTTERGGTLVPVAIMGVVPVKVTGENGPIRPNDVLAVSPGTPGHAAKAVPVLTLENGQHIYAGGTIVGRALDGLDQGSGTIRVLLR